MAQVKSVACSACTILVLTGSRFSVVISRTTLVGWCLCVLRPSMQAELAASSAPDEEPSGATPVPVAIAALGVVAGSAPLIPAESLHSFVAPEASVGEEVKEEVVDLDPEEESNIVGDFLGSVEVETLDLLGIEEQNPTSSETLPAEAEGAAPSAPLPSPGCVEASAAAEPEGLTVGTSPSAPSKPPRTRGSRGGKDSVYKNYRRVYYHTWDQLKNFLSGLIAKVGQVLSFRK